MRHLLLYVWLVGGCLAGSALASTRPATTVCATDQAPRIADWLAKLAHAEDAVREEARQQLLGLKRSQLPALVKAVEDALPLAASQVAGLREIVTHVYLSGEPYNEQAVGFLGVMLPRDDPNGNEEPAPIVVEGRLPGFCSYRMLQDGDIILAIIDGQPRKLRDKLDLIASIAAIDPGRQVQLEILRQGRRLRVILTLDARPLDAVAGGGAAQIEAFRNARQALADAYWQKHFAPLLARRVS